MTEGQEKGATLLTITPAFVGFQIGGFETFDEAKGFLEERDALLREISSLKRLLGTERDAFGKREIELMQDKNALLCAVRDLRHDGLRLVNQLSEEAAKGEHFTTSTEILFRQTLASTQQYEEGKKP